MYVVIEDRGVSSIEEDRCFFNFSQLFAVCEAWGRGQRDLARGRNVLNKFEIKLKTKIHYNFCFRVAIVIGSKMQQIESCTLSYFAQRKR